ncbi:beta/gamma crystallin domain-containing protein [Streptomyces sp. NBC_00328]|uniref:beta/gamma crystallin domain-containing protein n=1 Tax=Streptomyces sp. NBC_00328 TaxID=2903646 RepID=UPI002E2DE5BD|nr:beta/gamma crystallin domain-containing protein [Streptomyces sp. NBC_00328]
MKRSISRITLVAAAGAMMALLPALPASATNQTDCGDRTDFVKVWYNGNQTACFANAGVIAPQLPNVSRIRSGDNNIEIMLGDSVRAMPKWSSIRDVEGLSGTLYILQIL